MNTHEKLKEAIKDEVLMLPKETQVAIASFDWLGESEKIGQSNNLTDDEINDLQTETALVLVGLTDPYHYAKKIENEVGTTKEEAEKISLESFQKIFTPLVDKIAESIKSKLKDKSIKW